MATYEQNLQKIRGEAIYGTHVREAIAGALEQVDDTVQPKIDNYKGYVDSATSQYENRVGQSVQQVSSREDQINLIINDHLFYISVEQIDTTQDYTLSIQEGSAS